MATDQWNGTGNWTGNPTDWSTGAAPGSTAIAEIQTGNNNLTSSTSVKSVIVDHNANLVVGSGGSLTTTGGINNSGNFTTTNNSQLTIGGVLTNSGVVDIGTLNLSASTTATASGLINSGTLVVWGSPLPSTTIEATFDITGTNSATVTGSVKVWGDADLELTTGITAVAYGAFFQIDGAEARVSLGSGTTSTAVTGLASNEGTVNFDGNCELGAGGTVVTTTTGFDNAGTLWIDMYGGDGGTNVTFGGTLTNSGTALIGDTTLGSNASGGEATTTVTASGFSNSGSLTLQGNTASGTTNQATLDITGTNSATVTGTVKVLGDADLELTTGITTVAYGALFQIDGAEARVSLGSGTTSTALNGLASNEGTVSFDGNSFYGAGGTTVTTTTSFDNAGTLWIDYYYDNDGGTNVTFGGALTNSGTAVIGNTTLGNAASGGEATTTVTASSLSNTGSLTLQGNTASDTTNQATLDITGAATATATGYTRICGDALLEFASGGITSIGGGAWLELDGSEARITTGGTTVSALQGLATNYGTLVLRGNSGAGYGAGGASVTTTTALANDGTLWVDQNGSDGGSTLTIGGQLNNSGAIIIGNYNLSASTTVKATTLINSDSLIVQGNASSGTTDQATLDITGGAAAAATGTTRISGDALLEFGSKGITSIAGGAWLELDGSEAQITTGGTTVSALTGLENNHGTLLLRGNSGYGAGGASVTTTIALNNDGTLWVDQYGSDGGSTLTIGGYLTNSGTAVIGNNNLSASTTVKASGLTNYDSLIIQGNASSGTTDQATLDITGASAAAAAGYTRISGDALLEFGSAGITSIAGGAWLELDGSEAQITTGGTTVSALTGLKNNHGTLVLRGNSGYGAGGASVTTTTGLTNDGTLWVDQYSGDGGSTLTLGGYLTNSGTAIIGNTNLSALTTVKASGLTNYDSLTVQGNASSGTTDQATLDLTGAAAAATTGYTRISGDALLEFGSKGITSIAGGAWLELDGSEAQITTGGTTVSALQGLATNNGTLLLRGDTSLGAGGASVTTTTGLTNDGTLWVDQYGGDGGSTLTLGGALTNWGTAVIGNNNLSAATTVTTSSLANYGSLSLYGGSNYLAKLVVSGSATNSGSLSIGADSTLDVTGSYIFTQNSGTTTVAGTLVATTIDANGGLLDFTAALTSGDGTGNFNIGADGTLEFGGAVDSSHTVTFAASTGALELASGAQATFAATIAGFSGNDVIDLAGATVIGLSYSNSTDILTVTGSSGTIATLKFSGSYTQSDFSFQSDGNGGTDIVDPPPVATIGNGATVAISSASTETVKFVGKTGELILDHPNSFAGTVEGFRGQDRIDLRHIGFSADSTLGYAANNTDTGGTLTVSDGIHTANIALLGQYTAASFAAASDGHGGTMIADPAVVAQNHLAQPQA